MKQETINKVVLALVAALISALFLTMIADFLMVIFMAGLFAAVFHPFYLRARRRLAGREALASLATVLVALCFVFVPILLVGSAAVGQAVLLQDNFAALIRWVAEPGAVSRVLEYLPFYEALLPFREVVISQLTDVLGSASKKAVELLQSVTIGTVNMVLQLVIAVYAMFFLLIDGDKLLKRILYYLPLDDHDEQLLLNRFTSVTRATIKGTVVIGVLQGGLAGIAFALVGLPSALFWSIAMMLLSVVPGIGTALVWVPATLYLLATGEVISGIGLGLFCAVVVGSLDNVLRPKLVGNDTELHELMIFFSTMGGLAMFGFLGFIIGPIVGALFVTVWHIYGVEFKAWLPATGFRTQSDIDDAKAD
ncbi:MAG: AI-2E family transporter [Pseudomonadota bacterium]